MKPTFKTIIIVALLIIIAILVALLVQTYTGKNLGTTLKNTGKSVPFKSQLERVSATPKLVPVTLGNSTYYCYEDRANELVDAYNKLYSADIFQYFFNVQLCAMTNEYTQEQCEKEYEEEYKKFEPTIAPYKKLKEEVCP